jgi:putative addiction module component (TIGR02574 family)
MIFGMSLNQLPQLQQLTKEEKLELIGDLWESISTTPDDLVVSDEERAILDERLKADLENLNSALTLEEFKAQLEQRL